jgi:methyltransferase (TIGR00027 family)
MAASDSRRHDGDSWDLASSVGATATAVAARRAMASKGPNRLIDDPFAEPLVNAVGVDAFIKMMNGEIELAEDDPAFTPQRLAEGMAVRTRFFDNFFADAAAAGVRQAVILAAGLDTRAYRLPWPPDTVIYEIDQPQVIEFKTRTLADLGAAPAADHRPVAVDLRDDWPQALRDNGFDSGRPTAWIAEGLLGYLPPEAQDRLFDNITALSVPGKAIATEYVPGLKDIDFERVREQTAQLREHGLDIDMPSLVYAGERSHVIDYLRGKGWNVAGTSRADLFVSHGLTVPTPDNDDPLGEVIYVSGPLGS